jgi:EAL domain-containing protein (putative c-di-GMP-specific phosphodiesterase class I)/ActR/RegA family two-component response regulator
MESAALRVLVVDDDPFALNLLARQLAQVGVNDVHTCSSAESALGRLGDGPQAFDALICDLNMPGMDGVEFLRHLARRRYRGGLVLASGEDDRILQSVSRLAKARRLNVLGALRKPVMLEHLRRLLQSLPTLDRNSGIRPVTRAYSAAEIERAIFDGQLLNHYQPQVAFAGAEVIGVEALVRWRHPEDGLVFPDRFIADAEAFGLIDALSRAVLAGGLADARRWQDEGFGLRLSINVAMDNLVALDFPDRVVRDASAAGIAVDHLVLEVTESQAMRDPMALLDIATRLRLKRIGLSLDDFGTGYSSLAQMRDIPFDELKLDRSFVHGASRDPSLRAILQANLGMARQLGLRTVAEGVEDREDWTCLGELGCDVAQGYFVARPMPAAEIAHWVNEWRARHREPRGSA